MRTVPFIIAIFCVALACINIPNFPDKASIAAFVFCMCMAGLNVIMGIVNR